MEILNTLKKVEKALDLRFEKDSSLYVSKEDTEKIKEALYKSQFQNINAFVKKFGNKIIGKIIINNNWLLKFNQNKKELKKLFNNIDKNFLKDISKEIIEDKVYSSMEFKRFIKQYYLETISLKECQIIYNNDQELIQHRVICFRRYLKEDYLINNTLSHSIRFIDSVFQNFQEIYNYIQQHNVNFLTSIFQNTDDIDIVLEWILENKIIDRKDKTWMNLVLSNKNISFKIIMNYISNNPTWDNKITKFLIHRILVKFNKLDQYTEKIVEVYSNYWQLRLLFIYMLEPDKFKNKDLANHILDQFEDIGLPNKSEKNIEQIRNWNESNNLKGFQNRDDLIQDINNGKHDFTNIKTLDYYSSQLKKTKKDIILDTYSNFSNDNNLKLILSYYFTYFLKREHIPKSFSEVIDSTYINEIARYIVDLNINTVFSKKFLEDHNKHMELIKFNKR